MAKKTASSSTSNNLTKHKVKRKGVHAKTKASYSPSSKNYLKRYSGQGR